MTESSLETRVALLESGVRELRSDVVEVKGSQSEYVRKDIFDSHKEQLEARLKPLERLLYGVVGLILMGVVTAILATVVVTP